MNRLVKPALIAAVVSCALVLPQLSIAKEGKKRHGPLSEISLTDEQRLAIKEIGALKKGKKRKANPIKMFAPIIFDDAIDEQQLELIVDASIATRKAEGLIAAQKRFEVRQVLSDEQIVELATLHAERKVQRPEKPSLEERLTNKLSLSAEQVAQMQTAFNNLAELKASAMNEKQAFKAFEQSLLEQSEFDADAWLAQFELVSTNMRANSKSFATNMHSIYALLSDEQQRQLKRFTQKRKGKGKKKLRS